MKRIEDDLNKGRELSLRQVKRLQDHTKVYVERSYPEESSFVCEKIGQQLVMPDGNWLIIGDYFRKQCRAYEYLDTKILAELMIRETCKNSPEEQSEYCIEEMAELVKEFQKAKRGSENRVEVLSEICDVFNTLKCYLAIIGVQHEDFKKMMQDKLAATYKKNFLAEEKNGEEQDGQREVQNV